ncbi:MAG: thiamine phosphate synthase, partial [Calditrichota bacterium]
MTSDRIRQWQLYVITDENLSGCSHLEVARSAIAGGADVIQLRDKAASSRKLYEVGRDLLCLAHESGVPVVINDRVDIALAIGADGVHLGQEDLPIS